MSSSDQFNHAFLPRSEARICAVVMSVKLKIIEQHFEEDTREVGLPSQQRLQGGDQMFAGVGFQENPRAPAETAWVKISSLSCTVRNRIWVARWWNLIRGQTSTPFITGIE